MITSWDIYWITRLDTLNAFFCITGIGLLIVFVGLISWIGPMFIDDPFSNDDKTKHWEIYKKSMIWGTSIGIVLTIISAFIPTTKEFAAIYLIPKIANNEQVQKMPDNMAKLLNAKLEEWIASTTEKKSK